MDLSNYPGKLCLVFICCLTSCWLPSFAQNQVPDSSFSSYAASDSIESVPQQIYYRHEIRLSRGKTTTDDSKGNKTRGVPTQSYHSLNPLGVISATYALSLSPGLSVGCTASFKDDFGKFSFLRWSNSKNFTVIPVGRYKRRVFTAATEITVNYTRRDNRNILYGGLGVGLSYQNELVIYDEEYHKSQYNGGNNWLGHDLQTVSNLFQANFNVTAIGFKIARRLGFFAELGYGYKGILNFGVLMRFQEFSIPKAKTIHS